MIKIFKIAGFIFMISFLKACFFAKPKVANSAENATKPSVYGIALNTLNGQKAIDFGSFKGKKILIVNTASKCGFTPQYKDLQALSDKYKDKLVVIGCPCNQFGAQEPGDSSQIQEFCQINYGVSFTISEKLDVKGKQQHPLYAWLTSKAQNGNLDSEVTWNFCKYLLSEDGKLLAFFPSTTKPMDNQIISLIEGN